MTTTTRLKRVFHKPKNEEVYVGIIILNLNPLSATFTKWSNTLKQFVGKLPTNCLSVFDNFLGLVLKGLMLKNLKIRFLSNRASIKLLFIERLHTRSILSTKYFLSQKTGSSQRKCSE